MLGVSFGSSCSTSIEMLMLAQSIVSTICNMLGSSAETSRNANAPEGAMQQLVVSRALPVDEVAQPPRILVQLDLQLAVLVDRKLAGWIQDASALALVLIIQVEFA